MPGGIEDCRVLLLDNLFGYLWKKRVPPREVDLNRKSVACNRSVAFFPLSHVTFQCGEYLLDQFGKRPVCCDSIKK